MVIVRPFGKVRKKSSFEIWTGFWKEGVIEIRFWDGVNSLGVLWGVFGWSRTSLR